MTFGHFALILDSAAGLIGVTCRCFYCAIYTNVVDFWADWFEGIFDFIVCLFHPNMHLYIFVWVCGFSV